MSKLMLIDAVHQEETRVALVNNGRVEDFDFETTGSEQLRGNIYLAKVTRVEPSLQACFVEYGGNRHGFLAFSEIHPDYYQLPQADREALLEEAAREAEAAASKAFTGGGVSADLPTFEIARADFADGPTTTALLRAGELVASNGEARRKMNEGAVRVNDAKVGADQTHAWGDILNEVEAFKVQVGKKRIALVKPV